MKKNEQHKKDWEEGLKIQKETLDYILKNELKKEMDLRKKRTPKDELDNTELKFDLKDQIVIVSNILSNISTVDKSLGIDDRRIYNETNPIRDGDDNNFNIKLNEEIAAREKAAFEKDMESAKRYQEMMKDTFANYKPQEW